MPENTLVTDSTTIDTNNDVDIKKKKGAKRMHRLQLMA